MKKIIMALYSFMTILSYAEDKKQKVYITQFVECPALNTTIKGIVDGLKKRGYDTNIDIRIESAQANSALASQIATKFVNQNPDIVVGVGTISSQTFSKYAQKGKTQLVFSSVTDPLQAELIKTLKKPENNTTGVSNYVSLTPQLKIFKRIQPNLKRLGFIYNPSEMNSLSLIKDLEKICPKLGINLVLQTASKTSEIAQATAALVEKADAIFISNDNTALSALKTIIAISTKSKKPVYVSDTDSVEQGAIAALGPNQYNIGLQTANLIARGLKGEKLGKIAVEFPKKTELYLNMTQATALGMKLPSFIVNQADKIIK